MENNCIINWDLHQKLMNKKKTITVCTGIGSNMFFPEYIEIQISSEGSDIITEYPKDFKTPRKEKKISKEKGI